MLKGEMYAMLETPPNNKLFDTGHAISPVLKQQLKSNTTTPAPVFNFSISNEVARLFNQAAPIGETAPAAAAAAIPSALFPPTHASGQDIPIEHFCQQHQLNNDVLQKLTIDTRVLVN